MSAEGCHTRRIPYHGKNGFKEVLYDVLQSHHHDTIIPYIFLSTLVFNYHRSSKLTVGDHFDGFLGIHLRMTELVRIGQYGD
eukprot:472145-Prorocentrum_minimum.AAC.2